MPKLRSATGFLFVAFGTVFVCLAMRSSATALTSGPSNPVSLSVCQRSMEPVGSRCLSRRPISSIAEAISADERSTRNERKNSAL